MSLYIVALIVSCIAGLRAFIAPVAICWLAYENVINVSGSWAGFTSNVWTVGIFSILVVIELVTDQLPKTPSRKVPQQFAPRIISGAFCAAVLAAQSGGVVALVVLAIIGVVIGAFVGFEFRVRLKQVFDGLDRPAAIIEDLLAFVLVALVAVAL
ncbi:DUF4126 family protein [Caballeronia sp. 15715]|uniref:DUF4126 family protein n=1 Tax=Caballeronia sp. 15715 TaxID=3391030 RepID=UPI0039E66E45